MRDREKLIELLEKGYSFSEEECHKHNSDCECCIWYDGSHLCGYVAIADYLIKNGVTVQRWIPVSERLPEKFVTVLVQMPLEGPTVTWGFLKNDGRWYANYFNREDGEVTHWMPMPQPPKGE